MIEQQSLAGVALEKAATFLGDKATIGEWRNLAIKLARAGDAKYMDALVSQEAENRKLLNENRRLKAGGQRLAQGVDQASTAVPSAGSASDFDILERRFGDGVASLQEENRYLAMRAQRGL